VLAAFLAENTKTCSGGRVRSSELYARFERCSDGKPPLNRRAFKAGLKERGIDSVTSNGVHFVGIDVRDNSSAGLAFEQGHHVPFPSISDSGNLIAARFGSAAPTATPSTYILDTRGRIAWAYFGRTTFSQLESAVVQVAGS